MKILTVGDVVSPYGCDYLMKTLPKLKHDYSADLTIVNAENSAAGNGVLPKSAQSVFDAGADVITLGNHALRRPEIYDYLEREKYIVRPANYHPSAPGRGTVIVDKGYAKAAVINLQGAVYLDAIRNPFECAKEEIAKAREAGAGTIIIDFHAEAQAKKSARVLSGRRGLRDFRNAYSCANLGQPNSAKRHGVYNRYRNDGAARFRFGRCAALRDRKISHGASRSV